MSYQVTARKWRPRNFDEVVYQDHVSRTLRNSIKNGRVSHAYLFSGPRGVGKTTMARILARALNCAEGPTETPCGKCDNCLEIRNGNSFDVIEIDGASNRGIEDIRELRENVNFAPVKSKYKVYIIDEVHMLTPPAFNALLKTLEEPPGHVVFIFATTEIHQIPETILSRCQKYFFKKIPIEAIVDHLKHIVEKDGFLISEKALYPIARAADGSMRDAQSLLDQVVSFSDLEEESETIVVRENDALAILGIVPLESYMKLLNCVVNLDIVQLMGEVSRIITLGVDVPRYAAGLMDVIRTLRLLKNNVELQELLGLARDEIALLKTLADEFFDEELSVMFKIMSELLNELRYSNNERVHLEMSLIDMISVRKSPSLSAIIQKLEEGGGRIVPEVDTSPASKAVKEKPAETGAFEKKTAPAPEKKSIHNHWQEFLEGIKEKKQYLHFLLKPSQIAMSGDTLKISYSSGDEDAYYTKILDEKNIQVIKTGMSEILGKNISVTIDIVEPVKKTGAGDIEKPGPDNEAPPVPDSEEGSRENEFIPPPEAEMLKNPGAEDYEQHNPTVEKIKNTFHGQVIDKGDKNA